MNGYWKIRFDIIDNAEYGTYLEEISANCDRAVFYYHPDGKTDGKSPHIHGLLYNYKYTDDTIRKNTKKQFNLIGKESCTVSNTYSRGTKMSDMTYPRYLTYMTKGKYDNVHSKDFSIEECDLAKSLWTNPTKTEVNIIIEPREKVIPKLTQFQCAQEVVTMWQAEHGDDEQIDYDAVLDIIYDVLRKNKTLAHDTLVSNILQDVQSQYDRKKVKARIMRRCMF